MTQGERAIVLWAASTGGIILLLAGAVLWFPALMAEKNRIQEIRARLTDRQTLEAEAQAFSRDIQSRVERLNEAARARAAQVDQASFPVPPESDMPGFIEELQTILARPEARLLNLAYQPRVASEGFVTLPFEARLESSYGGLRHLLYLFESHPARIRIDQLDFQSFDNERHLLEYKMACSIRFAQHGR